MGNFYTNIVVREPDIDRVAAALQPLGRRAYVASDGRTTVVFDEQCDRQDLDALRGLALDLSRGLGCVALAACNHDDDVLWYALVENGAIVDTYESDSGYFDGSGGGPAGGDAVRLSAAFGAGERAADVETLLRKQRPDVAFEVERHRELLELLGLPVDLGLMGYGSLNEGELPETDSTTIRALGGAAGLEASPAVGGTAVPPTVDHENLKRLQAEGEFIAKNTAALVFARVEIPPRFVALFGAASMNGYVALMRLQEYIVRRKLQLSPGIVRADDLLSEWAGAREFPLIQLMRIVVERFNVTPLTASEAKQLPVAGSDMQRRYREAMLSVALEMSRP
jgi:hypothetical protein